MGTPDFAAVSLTRLYDEGHDIAGVFTQPDKPRSRGMKVSFSPVKEVALSRGTPVCQPVSLKDGEALKQMQEMKCDLAAVVAYGKFLTRDMLQLPPLGCINIHASLLPEYRGAAPIAQAILDGADETGVTSIYLSDKLDAGDVILSKSTLIDEDETAGELYDRLSVLGAELLIETIDAIKHGRVSPQPQDNRKVTFAPPLNKEMSRIDWSETAQRIKCKVRGLNPWPVATAQWGGTVFKIFSVDINEKTTAHAPGEIVSSGTDGLEVACSDGVVLIKELQAPGGKRMSAADYLRGHSI